MHSALPTHVALSRTYSGTIVLYQLQIKYHYRQLRLYIKKTIKSHKLNVRIHTNMKDLWLIYHSF